MTDTSNKGPRACKTCAKAKSRCVPGPVANICERCHRLNKPCGHQTPAAARRRRVDDGGPSAEPARGPSRYVRSTATGRKTTRVAELERRLEDLTWRLDAVARLRSTPPRPDGAAAPLPSTEEEPRAQRPLGQRPLEPVPARTWPSFRSQHIFPVVPDDDKGERTHGTGDACPAASSSADGVSPATSSTAPSPASNDSTAGSSATTPPTSSSALSSSTRPMRCLPPAPYSFYPGFSPRGQPVVGQRAAPPLSSAAAKAADSGDSGDNSNNSDDPWPQAEEAETLLAWFRRTSIRLMPMVAVPAGLDAAQLRAERPFVWKGAMMTAMHLDGARQTRMGNRLQADMVAAAFQQRRRRAALDLLQGLLLWITWYHFNANSFQLNNMLFLARSLCVSLGAGEQWRAGVAAAAYAPETLEVMRAYAGTFYVVSAITTTARKPDALARTDVLDRYCEVLEQRQEYATDRLLAQLVRVQQLGQTVSGAFQPRSGGGGGGGGGGSGDDDDGQSTMQVVRRLEQQVAAFRAQLPADVAEEPGLMGHVQIVETMLYEVGMQDGGSGGGSGPSLTAAERLELLAKCTGAVQRYMQLRFDAGVQEAPPFACLTSFDYIYAFLMSLRLMSYRMAGWDPRQARRDLAFDAFLEQQIANMMQLAVWRTGRADGGTASQEPDCLDAFARLGLRMAALRTMIVRELDKMPADGGGGGGSSRVAVDVAAMLGEASKNTRASDNDEDNSVAPSSSAPSSSAPAAPTPSADVLTPFSSMFASTISSSTTPFQGKLFPTMDGNELQTAATAADAPPSLAMAGGHGGFDTYMADVNDPFIFSDATADFIQGMDMTWPDMNVAWDETDLNLLGIAPGYSWGV